MVIHRLKVWPALWQAVCDNEKPFEVRKDDRQYQKGDVLELVYYNPETDYTAEHDIRARRVTFVLRGGQFGIEPGYVVMGLANMAEEPKP